MTKQAWEIPCGDAVLFHHQGTERVCLKTHRVGKDFVHHYLIPLYPPVAEMALVYVDTDEELADLGHRLSFGTGTAEETSAAAGPGHLFATERGTFLKVVEDPKSQKAFTYIDVQSGEMYRRRERGVRAVYRRWEAVAAADGASLTLAELHARHCP